MYDLIPFVHSQVQQQIKAELMKSMYLSSLMKLQGSGNICGCAALCFLQTNQTKFDQISNTDYKFMKLHKKSLVFCKLHNGIGAKQLLACMHDRVSVNC